MRLLSTAQQTLLLLAPTLHLAAAESATTDAPPECTASAGANGIGGFFDLRPDIAVAPPEGGSRRRGMTADYHASGFDYGYNFTLNICSSVVQPVEDVVGVAEDVWRNVSAYYTSGNQVYSIGQQSTKLRTRGRKLILQYTGGSPCGEEPSRSRRAVHQGASYRYADYTDEDDEAERARSAADDDEDKDKDEEDKEDKDKDDKDKEDKDKEDEDKKDGDKKKDDYKRRKSTIISFLCDHDPVATHASVHFVGTDPDECAYFFEARSQHACISAEPHQPGSVGPGGVFALIFGIALVVYFAGGIFYQRTVAHARGWRQLPNHNIWHGIWTFISDFAIIAVSSCARLLPSRRGYSQLSRSPNAANWRNRDDENRLIDQLDEEWDD